MSAPDMHPVTSKNIHSIGHRDDTLFVRFNSKGGPSAVYAYTGVDKSLFDRLKEAPSVGGFFHEHIRGQFPHSTQTS